MSTTLYFSKVNINSHIYNVYNSKEELNRIIKLLINNICDDIQYTKENLIYKEEGTPLVYDATYKFSSITKLDASYRNSIVGSIIKTSKIFTKKYDEEKKEFFIRPIENDEVIRFYFDIYSEIVVFYTAQRFGYAEFNEVFRELLNISASNSGEEFNFEIMLLKQGLSIEVIENELRRIGKIRTLKIDIIPPNPDEELLEKIRENGEGLLNSMKEGNLTETSILFTSSATEGMKLESAVVKNELKKVEQIHTALSTRDALNKGYANIEATSTDGRTYTTRETRPQKDILEKKDIGIREFADICKKKITSYLANLL